MNSNIEKIYTFDLIPWHKFKSSFLNKEDFKKGRIVQIIDDLSKKNILKNIKSLFLKAISFLLMALKTIILKRYF